MARYLTRTRALVAGALLVLAAAGYLGWSAWNWWTVRTDPGLSTGAARDDALVAGKERLAELSTFDYHDVPGGLARWLDGSTGPLHDQLARPDDRGRAELTSNATVATGRVLDAAVEQIDPEAGTARMLASVEITLARDNAAPQVRRNRFAADLSRTDSGWKLSGLNQIPVGTR